MLYPFNALLARMKYITRWSLMHSTRAESLSEHTCDTALLAHTLCLIARRYTGTPCRPKTVAVAALRRRGGSCFFISIPRRSARKKDVSSPLPLDKRLPGRYGGENTSKEVSLPCCIRSMPCWHA